MSQAERSLCFLDSAE